jgi:hypothetical protein
VGEAKIKVRKIIADPATKYERGCIDRLNMPKREEVGAKAYFCNQMSIQAQYYLRNRKPGTFNWQRHDAYITSCSNL